MAVVLAAGQGKRMQSSIQKVLHHVANRPMVLYVVDALAQVGAQPIVVVIGHQAESVAQALPDNVVSVEQSDRLGTADAVRRAAPWLENGQQRVLVLCGDAPLIQPDTVRQLLERAMASEAACVVLTAELDDPTGYGRIQRDEAGRVVGIVEERNATDHERQTREINSGAYCFESEALLTVLDQIRPNALSGEYYLTDAVGLLHDAGATIEAVLADDPREVLGVNSQEDLAVVEAVILNRNQGAS